MQYRSGMMMKEEDLFTEFTDQSSVHGGQQPCQCVANIIGANVVLIDYTMISDVYFVTIVLEKTNK
jgi:hypothetical protein